MIVRSICWINWKEWNSLWCWSYTRNKRFRLWKYFKI